MLNSLWIHLDFIKTIPPHLRQYCYHYCTWTIQNYHQNLKIGIRAILEGSTFTLLPLRATQSKLVKEPIATALIK